MNTARVRYRVRCLTIMVLIVALALVTVFPQGAAALSGAPLQQATSLPSLSLSLTYGVTENINDEPDEFQRQIEQSAEDYNAAVQKLADTEMQIEETQARIEELQLKLPEQKQRAAVAVNEYYHMQSSSNFYLELIFGASTFSDFLTKWEYVDRLQRSYLDEIDSMKKLNEELAAAQVSLESDRQAALEEKTRAEEALIDAQNARKATQEAAAAQREVEQANENAQSDAAGGSTGDSSSGGSDSGSTGDSGAIEGPDSDGADWLSEKDIFVNEWAGRINNYLAGTPLGGYGRTFAEAAWDYGVDPRFSPAISYTESSRGVYCFLPHNAWGWGSVSWPNWDTAIREHVRGLARGYGYTISVQGAQKYCPPNWEHWYNTTSAQMGRI